MDRFARSPLPIRGAYNVSCDVCRAAVAVVPCPSICVALLLKCKPRRNGYGSPMPVVEEGEPMRVLFIGRLDGYKRLDWLLMSLAAMRSPWRLSVVGDGPNRSR